jgi:hypothetical protein
MFNFSCRKHRDLALHARRKGYFPVSNGVTLATLFLGPRQEAFKAWVGINLRDLPGMNGLG